MDSNSVNWNDYYEIINVFAPYCGPYWCGFDYETIKKNNKTPWICLSTNKYLLIVKLLN